MRCAQSTWRNRDEQMRQRNAPRKMGWTAPLPPLHTLHASARPPPTPPPRRRRGHRHKQRPAHAPAAPPIKSCDAARAHESQLTRVTQCSQICIHREARAQTKHTGAHTYTRTLRAAAGAQSAAGHHGRRQLAITQTYNNESFNSRPAILIQPKLDTRFLCADEMATK